MADNPRRVSNTPLSPVAGSASHHLRNSDPILCRLIDKLGPCTLQPRRDYFAALCEALINQQLSPKAAASIFRKVQAHFSPRRLEPRRMNQLTDAQLRKCGVSPQKLRYLRHLADAFLHNQIPIRRLHDLSDDDIITALTQVKGIGQWTAHMFLIFVLNRPDVLATGDLSLKKAIQAHYGFRNPPAERTMIRLAEPWRPYRSYASWFLWMGQG